MPLDEVINAAKNAQIHKFIMSLPNQIRSELANAD